MAKSLPIFFIFILLSIVYSSPSVAILSSKNDSPYLAKTIRQKLDQTLSSDVYTIRNTYDISKIISKRPDIIVLISEETTRAYLKYAPKGNGQIPVVALSSHDAYDELAPQIENGVSIVNATSATELFTQLSRFTGNLYPSVGYLYPDSLKEKAFYEMYNLKMAGITPYAEKLPEKPTEKLLISLFTKLVEKGVTVVRIVGTGETIHLIETQKELREFLAKRTSIVITDKQDLHHSLPGSVVVTVRQNQELLSAVTALVTEGIERSKVVPDDFTVTTDVASLHYGTVKHFSLMQHTPLLLQDINRAILAIDTLTSRTAIWELIDITLNTFSDTGVGIPSNQRLLLEDVAEGLDRIIFQRYTLRDIVITFGMTFLVLFILISLFRNYRRKLFNQRSAILYPRSVMKRVVSNPNGRNKKLVNYLKKEKYRPISAHSLTHYERRLKKYTIRLHLVDWELSEDAVQFLHNTLRDRRIAVPDVVIVFNIPRKQRLEVAPRFGDIAVHFFEMTPTTEELDRVLYGSGKQEHHVSYISGALTDDSLPPIFQMLETNGVNGALLLEDPNPYAAIFYRNGVIVYAEDRLGTTGEQSLFNALSKRDGTFRFEKERRSPVENLSVRSMDLLMRWAAQSDESAR